MVFQQQAEAEDNKKPPDSLTAMFQDCASITRQRRARRRFGAMQGATQAEDTHHADQYQYQRPAPSARFFHPDVCDMLAQADTIDYIVDNAHGRSLMIFVPSIDDAGGAGAAPSSNRASRRNGMMQGFGSTDELSDHVPKQQSSSFEPPRMPVRRLTNESDDEDTEKESHYGDCLPSKPERRPTNEDQVDDSSSPVGKKATRRLGLSNNESTTTVPERRLIGEERQINDSKKSSAGKARRRLGLSNGQNSSIALEGPPRMLNGGSDRFLPLKDKLQHYESDHSLEKMLLAPRLPSRKPSPPMGEHVDGVDYAEMLSTGFTSTHWPTLKSVNAREA